jgi:hypothetical protein
MWSGGSDPQNAADDSHRAMMKILVGSNGEVFNPDWKEVGQKKSCERERKDNDS